jgi:hypothetical protein
VWPGQNGWAYESNYGSGLRVVDVSSVAKDPTGGAFAEVAFFDRPVTDLSTGQTVGRQTGRSGLKFE